MLGDMEVDGLGFFSFSPLPSPSTFIWTGIESAILWAPLGPGMACSSAAGGPKLSPASVPICSLASQYLCTKESLGLGARCLEKNNYTKILPSTSAPN